MRYKLTVRVASVENRLKLDATRPSEVGISADPTIPTPPPGFTFDSLDGILQFIIDFSVSLEANLLAAWLVSAATQPPGKKSMIDGQAIPSDQAELAALIKKLIEQQASQARRYDSGSDIS